MLSLILVACLYVCERGISELVNGDSVPVEGLVERLGELLGSLSEDSIVSRSGARKE